MQSVRDVKTIFSDICEWVHWWYQYEASLSHCKLRVSSCTPGDCYRDTGSLYRDSCPLQLEPRQNCDRSWWLAAVTWPDCMAQCVASHVTAEITLFVSVVAWMSNITLFVETCVIKPTDHSFTHSVNTAFKWRCCYKPGQSYSGRTNN